MDRQGLILFAHGARDARWAEPFEVVAGLLRAAQPSWQVLNAYLEFMTPTLRDAGDTLARDGCTHITVLPMFLGAGGHVRKDLPVLMDSLRQAWPKLEFELLDAIGEQPAVLAAMADAAAKLVQERA